MVEAIIGKKFEAMKLLDVSTIVIIMMDSRTIEYLLGNCSVPEHFRERYHKSKHFFFSNIYQINFLRFRNASQFT